MIDELDLKILRELDMIGGSATNYYLTKQLFQNLKGDTYEFKKHERTVNRRLKRFAKLEIIEKIKSEDKALYRINYEKIKFQKEGVAIFLFNPSFHTKKV